MDNNKFLKTLKALGWFLFLALIFSISHTQQPLYDINQDGYFVHGLAKGGLGFLNEDWHTTTRSLFPVFNFLVRVTYQYLHENFFYFYFIILAGIYIYSIMGIASLLYNIDSTRSKYFLYLLIIIATHSRTLCNLSLKISGHHLTWTLWRGVAGQYILWETLLPSLFGVFLIFSIYIFLCKKHMLAVFLASLAAIFHPAYLLSAAILILSYMIIIAREKKNIKLPLLMGSFAFILVLPIITYTWSVFGPTSPEIWHKAQDILVNFKLPRHASPERWLGIVAYTKIIILIIAMGMIRKTRLFPIVLVSFLMALILTALQMLTANKTLALVFPWRVSVFLAPISNCVIMAGVVSYVFKRFRHKIFKYRNLLAILSLSIIFVLVLDGAMIMKKNFNEKFKQDHIPMMSFVKKTKSSGEVYLIPIKLKGFRLYTGAPIFVNLKVGPFKDIELIEWRKRVKIANDFYEGDGVNGKLVRNLFNDHGVTHIVLENKRVGNRYGILKELYKDKKYGVYKIDIQE